MPGPSIRLNNEVKIPQLGFGVFRVDPGEAERVVSEALEVGYRHIDTAAIYGNEEEVGRAIRNSGLARSEIFVTTKLWMDSLGRTKPLSAIDESLDRLGLDFVDLYLIHWPTQESEQNVDTWLAMQEIYEKGQARAIGVSNFLEHHLQPVIDAADVMPAVNQIELHPLFQQRPLRTFGESQNIFTEAWGPLGQGKYDLHEIGVLTGLAKQYGVSVQQIVIRWHLQEGVIVFPKTTSKDRMKQNFDVFDFSLTSEDMEAIRSVDENRRVGKHPDQ